MSTWNSLSIFLYFYHQLRKKTWKAFFVPGKCAHTYIYLTPILLIFILLLELRTYITLPCGTRHVCLAYYKVSHVLLALPFSFDTWKEFAEHKNGCFHFCFHLSKIINYLIKLWRPEMTYWSLRLIVVTAMFAKNYFYWNKIIILCRFILDCIPLRNYKVR